MFDKNKNENENGEVETHQEKAPSPSVNFSQSGKNVVEKAHRIQMANLSSKNQNLPSSLMAKGKTDEAIWEMLKLIAEKNGISF